jgi:fibronectin type 3 domain-containing protein
VRQYSLAGSLALLFLLGCDRTQPLAPTIQAAAVAGSGSTLNAPSGTAAVAVSESRIDVTWQDNSTSETGFEVHRSLTGGSGTFTLRVSTGAGVASYSDAGLAPLTAYCYQVRAFRKTGNKNSYSAFSIAACATTPAPQAPSGVDAKPAPWQRVDVTWFDNSTTEDGFRVERSLDGSSWITAGTVGPNVTSFSDAELASEQQVCYRVIVFQAQIASPPSTIDCTTPPASPASLTATAIGPQTIDLAWIDNSVVEDGYEVQRATAVFGPFGLVANLAQNAVGYRDAGLAADATYYYRVRAKKDGGVSNFSNYAGAVLASAPPNAPSGTNATPSGSSVVDLTWVDNSANEEGFRLERSTDGGASWASAGTTLAEETGFTEGGRFSEQQVCYRVIAFNRVGESPSSNTGCTTPPAGPTSLTATVVGPQTTDLTTIELTWIDNSSVEDGYEVHRIIPFCDYGDCTQVIADLPSNSTVYRLTVACGGFEYFMVRARKDSGSSDFSNVETVYTEWPCQ